MLSLRPHSYINTASVLQSTTKTNMTQSLKSHVSHKYISVHPSLTTMWYYDDRICTVLLDRLFSQVNHTVTHFCLHFPFVTITSQIAYWVVGLFWTWRKTNRKKILRQYINIMYVNKFVSMSKLVKLKLQNCFIRIEINLLTFESPSISIFKT